MTELRDVQSLDPVPCPQDTLDAYRETLDGMASLKLTLDLAGPESALVPEGQTPEGAAEAAVARAEAGVPDEALRLLALLGCLHDPKRPLGKRGGLTPVQQAAVRAAGRVATPHLKVIEVSSERDGC